MEGKYRQKSMYLDFFLILLTSLFFKTFKHVWHIIVFISMLWSLFFMLSLILYWNTNVSLFFPAWILTSFFHILYYVTYIDYNLCQDVSLQKTLHIETFCFEMFLRRSKKKFMGVGGLDGLNFAPFCLFVSYCSL